jgi:hypothetical protein
MLGYLQDALPPIRSLSELLACVLRQATNKPQRCRARYIDGCETCSQEKNCVPQLWKVVPAAGRKRTPDGEASVASRRALLASPLFIFPAAVSVGP